MLNETTGAFDGARTHDLDITSQTRNPLHAFGDRQTDRQTGADGRTGKQAGRQTAIFTQVSKVTIVTT